MKKKYELYKTRSVMKKIKNNENKCTQDWIDRLLLRKEKTKSVLDGFC